MPESFECVLDRSCRCYECLPRRGLLENVDLLTLGEVPGLALGMLVAFLSQWLLEMILGGQGLQRTRVRGVPSQLRRQEECRLLRSLEDSWRPQPRMVLSV